MIIRKLNQHGLDEFTRFINELRNGSKMNTPVGLLSNDEFSEVLDFELDIDNRVFESRYELGVYLVEKLKSTDSRLLLGDCGLWSALALVWFDQLCPEKADDSRKPAMSYNYVLSENYNHRPRHAIFTTWQLVNKFGEDSRFLLSKALPVRGELIEQIMARQYYLGCEGVMKTASKLYYDPENKTFKKGSAGRTSAGCVYRFISWLQQLEINYDLFSMESDDLATLLPKEFDRFKPAT